MRKKANRELLGTALVAALMVACGANESVLNSGRETPIQAATQEQRSAFERDLDAMRTAKFAFVYAVRRRDGKTIDPEDIRVIKQFTADANRRVKTDDDRAVLIGSNFQIPKESLAILYERFAVEDHSPMPAAEANANTISNK
jgi:hypothetical protein